MRRRIPLPFMLPLMAGLFIVIYGGGLGISFIFLAKTDLESWGAVIIGLVIVVAVPTIGALLAMSRR